MDGIDTGVNSVSNDITPFRAVFNDMYAKDISNKIKSVKHNKQEQGLFIGSKAPFGYKTNQNFPNKLFIDYEAKPIIERIFFEATQGKTCRSIATDLNSDKVSTPSQYALIHGYKVSKQSSNWSDSRIREIILNEVYIGNMVQGRMQKINYKSKKNIRLPKKDWKIVKNTHDPIIDSITFQKANEMLLLRKQTRVKNHDYILKGFVYCHECGKKMYCSSRQLASGIKYYFRCSSSTRKSTTNACTPHSIRMDKVENLITNLFLNIIKSNYCEETIKQMAEDYYSKSQANNSSQTLLDSYKTKQRELIAQIDKLYADRISGILENDDFKRLYNRIKQTQNQLNSKISQLKKSNFKTRKRNSIVKKIIDDYKDNFELSKKYLTYFIDRIEIDKSKKIYIYCKYKNPYSTIK